MTKRYSIRPIGERILVQRVATEDVTKGGIIIPDKAKEKPKEAIVKALGTGKLLDNGERAKFSVKPGDRILLLGFFENEAKVGDSEYLFVKEEDILAVLDEKDAK